MSVSQDKSISVLFVCTGNSCRSIMAEAMLRHMGGDRFRALSAGSRPAGFIHPLAIHALTVLDVPLGKLESKSWNEFADQPIDAAITLCDSAAADGCPQFPGRGFRAHWGLPDPAFHPGGDEERAAFALLVAQRLRAKIEGLISLDWSATAEAIQKRLVHLGEI